MIQIFTCNKEVVTRAEEADGDSVGVDEGEGEEADEVVTAEEVGGDFVDVAEATIRIELHENTDSAEYISYQIKKRKTFIANIHDGNTIPSN
jgi:hypothetical protein